MFILLCKLFANKNKTRKDFLPYEQFVMELRNSGINYFSEYTKEYKNHSGWPSDPWIKYDRSWNEMLGKAGFPAYEQFIKELRNSGINSYPDYKNKYKAHSNWPSNPAEVYGKSWNELIGKNTILDYTQFILELRQSGINKAEEYKKKYIDHPGWPSSPWQKYNKTWSELLGKATTLDYEQFIVALRQSEIKKLDEYEVCYKEHPGWPCNPWDIYGKSWKVLIGKTPDPEQLKDKNLADIVDMLGGE